MSQAYDPEGQFGYAPEPKKKSGCLRGCVIALVILVLLIAAIIGVGIWIGREIVKGVTQDPQEVERQLHERFPSAKIPEGYEGRMGMHFKLLFDMHMIVLAKDNADVMEEGNAFSGEGLILFSMNVPGAKQEDLENNMSQFNKGGVVIKRGPYTVRAGEYEFEGFQQTVQQRQGDERKNSTQIVVPLGGGAVVVMQGTGDKVDEEALREFLSSIAKDCPNAKKAGEKEDKETGGEGDKVKKEKEKRGKGEKEKD